tara:strand:+ start:714 stop:2192 length:1479 start_codon:yes stop_codon:yes gene_type:complete
MSRIEVAQTTQGADPKTEGLGADATGSSGAGVNTPGSSDATLGRVGSGGVGSGDAGTAGVGGGDAVSGALPDGAADGSIADQVMALFVVLKNAGQNLMVDGSVAIDWPRVGSAITVLVIFLLVRRLITRVIISRLKIFAQHRGWHWKRRFVEASAGPISLVPIALGLFFFAQILAPTGLLKIVLDRVVQSLVAISIAWLVYNSLVYARPFLSGVERLFNPSFTNWVLKALQVAVAGIGLATVLEIWGIQVAPILAGFGLMGVAVALGAQDLFKNLIAGLLVLGEDRFDVGDWIRVDGVVEGTVERIGFRSTLIRRFDKAPVHVPNAKLSDSALTNFSDMSHRRIYWLIGVTYSSTVAQLREIRDGIESYVLKSDAFERPENAATFVRIDSFNQSSIDIMLYCFTKTTDWGAWLKVKEELAYHVMQVVERADASFAFPSTSLYVESLPGSDANGMDAPEAFVPPTEKSTEKSTGKSTEESTEKLPEKPAKEKA